MSASDMLTEMAIKLGRIEVKIELLTQLIILIAAIGLCINIICLYFPVK